APEEGVFIYWDRFLDCTEAAGIDVMCSSRYQVDNRSCRPDDGRQGCGSIMGARLKIVDYSRS
ncbi:hypothetical protein, partial [Janthinobacterium agaricidamnosum]|uniref:hypothetical protein n=1 Tax=Janthinobacterium agaricidamnosum TaxID=55508 RepID=UPI001C3F22F8